MTRPGPIAYLTGEYPRATDTFIQREVAALRALGWEVVTCSIRRTGAEHHTGPEQRDEAARTFHVLEATARPATFLRALGHALRRPARLLGALRLAWRMSPGGVRAHLYQLIYLAEAIVLAHELGRRGVRHLHNHIAKSSGTVALLASRVSGIPHSFTLHGPDIFFEPLHWRLDVKVAEAAFVACISEFCRSQAMAFSDRRHWGRLHVVHCGVEPDRYGPPGATAPRLLFVGRLAAVKGLPVLFEALEMLRSEVPGLEVVLVGDGPDRAALEREAPEGVSFAGYRSQDEVAEMLRGVQALVLPSFAEGVPVVLMEAMATGLPVIATRIAGIPELVEDGVSGLLVPPGDAAALAGAIRRVLSDEMLRSDMGAAGQAKVRADYRSDIEAARLSRLFSASLSGAPSPATRPDPEA
ncbi:glycosyltransferase [Aquicoccus sp. SCR17]|nr:glycosyltransferase [Carideicomes alvinocaridis]